MKKFLLLLLTLMGSVALFGQESITLTFTGQDENQDYVRLNNVVITNLTRGWSDQIVFPDTIYTLNNGVGVEEYATEEEMKVMPNPFNGATRINLSSAQTERARLMVVDMQGRLYAQYAGTLTAGDNYFNITLSAPQMYILTVQTPSRRQSLKMVNTGHGNANHITYSGNLPKAHRLEAKGSSTHTFFPGDEMRYVGTGQHLTADQPRESAVITQPQNTDETIVLNFVFSDGIPCPGMPTVTDHEGNVYNTVQIGRHCWTKENMRCVTSPTTGTYLITPPGTPYTCTGKQAHWVNGDSATYAPQGYGVLYNWNAAVDTFNTAYGEQSVDTTRVHPVFAYFSWQENRRGICPEGWHIPSLQEWPGNMATAFAANIGWNSCSDEGTPGYNPDSNNVTGFSALPAGFYFNNYNNFGTEAIFWTATRLELNSPIALYIDYNLSFIGQWPDPDNCFSVRCVRDYQPNSTPWTIEPEKGTPCPSTPTVTDHEGNVYNTVQIGSQCWTKENMRCRTSPTTGTDFVNNTISYEDTYYQIANSYTGKTAHWLNGDSIGHSNLGLLYNWNAAVDTFNTAYGELHLSDLPSDAVDVTFTGFRRGICPEGWHIPSVDEWNMLLNYVNSQEEFICQQGGFNYGNSSTLKSYMGWNQRLGMSCPELRNATGFTALPNHTTNGSAPRYLSQFWSCTATSINCQYFQVDEQNSYSSVNDDLSKNSDQSVRCVKNQPRITTAEVIGITNNSALCGGDVSSDGGVIIENKGVCWSTSHNPTLSDNHTEDGSEAGTFTSILTGLTFNTTYYVRAYALNSTDTVYGNEVNFTTPSQYEYQPCPDAPTLTDIDGNTYNTVLIGQQCWMKENLRTTHYSNNVSITDGGTNQSITTAYRYKPGNSSANVNIYGYLYNWKAVMHNSTTSSSNPSGVQGICPNGWHVPSDAEWDELITTLTRRSGFCCGEYLSYYFYNDFYNGLAKALADSVRWGNASFWGDDECFVGNSPENNNLSGFSALPAGYMSFDYDGIGFEAYFWSTTQGDGSTGSASNHAFYRKLAYSYPHLVRNYNGKVLGLSVRCVKD